MYSNTSEALPRTRRRFLPVLLVLLSGCGLGSSYSEPSMPSSSYSGSSYSGAPSQPAMPSREVTAGGFVVRPDTIVLPFALHVVHKDANEAITLLRKATGEIGTQAKTIAGASAVMRMRGITVSPVEDGKASDSESNGPVRVMVDGIIEVPLAPDLDFWQRGQLFANLSALLKSREKAGKGEIGEVAARCDAPKVILKNPEAYRRKLTEDWVKRARELAGLAEQAAVPLYLVDCDPPGDIVQSFISFEEVGLSLKATCRLDAVAPSGQGSPPGADRGR